MFNSYPALIWAIAFCCLCALLYLCTFGSYLKGVKGSLSQMANIIPMGCLSPKARSTAVSVFVVDVEANREADHVYSRSPTLNLEAILQDGKSDGNGSDIQMKSDSLTNLLVCDERNEKFCIYEVVYL